MQRSAIHVKKILRYDMHHSSMCGTVLSNAVYVLGAKVDIDYSEQ